MRPSKLLALLVLCGGAALSVVARPFTVVVYNVENLVDADGQAVFEEYQPPAYTPAHALTKLQNIAAVLARFEDGRGPDVVMLQEIEADLTPAAGPMDYEAVLRRYADVKLEDMLGARFGPEIADLPAEALLVKALADRGMTRYHVVVGENVRAGGDRPLGQKCVTLTRFPVKAARSHPTVDARAVLEVQVEIEGATLYLFNNHWKSGAGDAATEPTRVANARTLRARLDELLRLDPQADIVIGGDFNSQYNQKRRYREMPLTGMNDILGSQGNELAIRGAQRDLYNLWFELPNEQRGSDTFQGEWGTLMQMLITRGLYDYRGVQYVDNSFAVAKFAGLNAGENGTPVRWNGEPPAGSGFSDHFPIFARFTTVPDERPDRYLPLRGAVEEPAALEPVRKVSYAQVEVEKVAVRVETLPAGAKLRSKEYRGKIIRVEGTVGPGNRLTVEFLGDSYDVWSFDEALRKKLRAEYAAGQPIRFYGELGQYRGKWQFVIQDPSWVK